jgi:hypothetical protein
MKPSKEDNLHLLIHSMTPTEKRFLKRFLRGRKQEGNDYLVLFDIMNGMVIFNKEEFSKKASAHSFYRHIEVKKHHLLQLILDSQRQYLDSTLDQQNALIEIDILIDKGLHALALKRLRKCMDKAKKNDQFSLMVQLLEKELLLMRFLPNIDAKTILNEQQILLDKNQNLLGYKIILNNLYKIISENSFVRNNEQFRKLEKFSNQKLIKDISEAKSLSAKIYFYHINYLYNASIGENQLCYESAKKMNKLISKHPEANKSFARLYLRSIAARLSSLILNGYEPVEFETLVSELKERINSIESTENKKIAQAVMYQFQIIAYQRAQEYSKALLLVKESIQFLKQNQILADGNSLKYLGFDIAKTFFIVGNYTEANRWFLKINYVGIKNSGNDIYAFSRILSLLCDIFLKETENVKYNANYLRKQLSRLKALYEFESFLISRISAKFIHWHSLDTLEKIKLLKEFQLELQKHLSNKWKANTVLYFDFEWWTEMQFKILLNE